MPRRGSPSFRTMRRNRLFCAAMALLDGFWRFRSSLCKHGDCSKHRSASSEAILFKSPCRKRFARRFLRNHNALSNALCSSASSRACKAARRAETSRRATGVAGKFRVIVAYVIECRQLTCQRHNGP